MNSISLTRLIPLMILAMLLAAPALTGCAASSASGTTQEEGVVHQATAADAAHLASRDPIAENQAVLYVNGLGCPLCATNIDEQLKRMRGVTSAGVDLEHGTVTLGFAQGTRHPSPYELKNVVADAGFTLVKIETR
jgi:copper chaperone CopZ